MVEKDRIREINVDDIKSCLDRDTSVIVEDSVTDMLQIVRAAESEQDYWFVNYYQGAAFAVFFIGMMAGLMSGGQDLPATSSSPLFNNIFTRVFN